MLTIAILAALTLAAAGFGLYVLFPSAFHPSTTGHKRWGYLFGVILLAEVGLFVVAPVLGWWLPPGVSTYAPDIDFLFYAILGVTGFTFIGVSAVFIYALFKYPHDPARRSTYTHGSHKLEMIWTGIPAGVLLLLAVVQIPAWLKVKAASERTNEGPFLQMEVTARQWEWRVRYASPEHMKEWGDASAAKKDFRLKMPGRPDDVRLPNEIHAIKGQKTLIHLRTLDVLHSFFLPQMRLKQDALPGKTIPVWFQCEEANCHKDGGVWRDGVRRDATKNTWVKDPSYVWELACAEYCGDRHSLMRGKVFIHETEDDFLDWLRTEQRAERQATPESK